MHLVNFYLDSIDLISVYTFDQISKTGNYKLLHKGLVYSEKKALSAWEKILSEFVDNFGLNEQYKEYLKKQIGALNYRLQAANGAKAYLIHAKFLEQQANKLLEKEEENINTLCAKLSKLMGFPVNPKQISLRQFYSYLSIYGK